MTDHLLIRLATGAAALAASAGCAQAAADPADFCKGGQIAIVRLSTLIPGGTQAGFEKAAADQEAWYRSHGFTANRLITRPLIVQDPKTKDWTVSKTEFLSIHLNPPPISAVRGDGALQAFVQGFRTNSQLVADKTVCLDPPLR
jgi:hypothetical protein